MDVGVVGRYMVEPYPRGACETAPVVLLHGFAGTARHWDRVIAELPSGRYATATPSLTDAAPLTPDGVTDLVARAGARAAILVGYSMGGRLALHSALAIPDRIARLVLISASAGIDDARSVRRAEPQTTHSRRRSRRTRSSGSWRAGARCRCSPPTRTGSPRRSPQTSAAARRRARSDAPRAGTGRDGADVGSTRLAGDAGGHPGRRARRRLRAGGAAAWRRASAARTFRARAGRGAPRGSAGRRRGRARALRGQASRYRPSPGPRGTTISPRTTRSCGGGVSNSSSVARPHAGSGARRPPRATRRRCPSVRRRSTPGRPRRRCSHERGRCEQGADAAAAGDLQADGVGNARGEGAGHRGGLVDRDAQWDTLAELPRLLQPAHRLLDELEPVGAELGEHVLGFLDAPRAVGVESQARAGADRFAHRRDPFEIPLHADLELDARVSVGDGVGGRSRGARRHLCGDARVHGDGRCRRLAQQIADRTAGALACQIPQRDVDRRERLGQVVQRATRVEQRTAAAADAAATGAR